MENTSNNTMVYIIGAVVIVAIAVLAFLFLYIPASTPPSPEPMPAIELMADDTGSIADDVNSVNVGDLDKEFQNIDNDLQAL